MAGHDSRRCSRGVRCDDQQIAGRRRSPKPPSAQQITGRENPPDGGFGRARTRRAEPGGQYRPDGQSFGRPTDAGWRWVRHFLQSGVQGPMGQRDVVELRLRLPLSAGRQSRHLALYHRNEPGRPRRGGICFLQWPGNAPLSDFRLGESRALADRHPVRLAVELSDDDLASRPSLSNAARLEQYVALGTGQISKSGVAIQSRARGLGPYLPVRLSRRGVQQKGTTVWVGSWAAIVETFQSAYDHTQPMGALDVQLVSADNSGNWGNWALLAASNSYVRTDN